MRHTRFTPKEKTAIVIESIKTSISTAELCRKHQISPHTFARWMDRFIEGGKESLSRDDRNTCRVHRENDKIKLGKLQNYGFIRQTRKLGTANISRSQKMHC